MSWIERYVQVGGDNRNAGNTTDDSPALEYVDGNWTQGTLVFTVPSGNPISDGIEEGDWCSVYDSSAAQAAFAAPVASRTSTTITLNGFTTMGVPPTNGTGNRSLRKGGAWAGPTASTTFPLAFISDITTDQSDHIRLNIKAGTYQIRSTATPLANITIEGYTTTPGDQGKATLQGGTSGASHTVIALSNARVHLRNFILINNGGTGSNNGITMNNAWASAENCIITGMRGTGLSANPGLVINCTSHGNNLSNDSNNGGFSILQGTIRKCLSYDNLRFGYRFGGTAAFTTLQECIAYGNAGHGFEAASHRGHIYFDKCVAYNNGSSGFHSSTGGAQKGTLHFNACIAEKNGTWGFHIPSISSTDVNAWMQDCASYDNEDGHVEIYTASNIIRRFQELTASPFVDAPEGDFALNDAAGGGAVLRPLAIPIGAL